MTILTEATIHLREMMAAVGTEISSPAFFSQLVIIAAGGAVAYGLGKLLTSRTTIISLVMGWPAPVRLLVRTFMRNISFAIFAAVMFLIHAVMIANVPPHYSYMLVIAAQLALAWLVIRLLASIIRNEFLMRAISIIAWSVAALSITGLLPQTLEALDSVGIVVGDLRLTPLLLIKLVVLLAVTLWAANIASNFIDAHILATKDLTPSVQVLLSKLIRLVLIVVAIAVVLSTVGINLAALAIFSGAIGVGIGFGLQKIVANFISGVILLADKSIKPGDLISVGDNQGRVSTMNTRYISVAAGDGREFLIPNEDLITKNVVNWTYTSKETLVKIPFSVNYEADPRFVCNLAIEVAKATPNALPTKAPNCQLQEFGETAIRYTLSFWLADPDGVSAARSDVMMRLWDAFKHEDIHVPYPVREIRLRNGPLPVDPVGEQGTGRP